MQTKHFLNIAYCLFSFCLCFCLSINAVSAQNKDTLQKALQQFTKKLPTQSTLLLHRLRDNQIIFSHNSDLPLKPASVLKILTSHAALSKLGINFIFETNVSGSQIQSGHVQQLTIKGLGDPALRIEELMLLVRRLKLLQIKSVEQIFLDDSAFVGIEQRAGMRAYEASGSALAFNYNSIRLQVCPTAVGQAALVVSDPYEYPVQLLGTIKTVAGAVSRYAIDESAEGVYKVSGEIGTKLECSDHYRAVPEPLNYLAHVLARQLADNGIAVGKITRGTELAQPAWSFKLKSRELVEHVTTLNHYSSNFIAEQILFALGKTGEGSYSRQQGLAVIAQHVLSLDKGFNNTHLNIVDGSGLSHDNRITARILAKSLDNLWQDQKVRVEFERSLAVQGQSGTLKSRPVIPSLVVRAKTGSLNGVSALAGYIYPEQSAAIALVMIQNGSLDRNRFINLENELLFLIKNNI